MSEPTIEERLDELQRQSEARRQELRTLAAEVPAALSRTALLRSMVADLRHAPHKGEVVSRGLRKAGRSMRGGRPRVSPVPAGVPVEPAPAEHMTPVDINELLHELRSIELGRLPKGAATFVSAGCAGRWYFDWIEQWYGPVERHIGIEAFAPEPADLPANVTWIADNVAAMTRVPDASADVVFSGQNIEHLWPTELAGFLAEANRVLRPDGLLVVDSPNRSVTARLNWSQPEHTVEWTPVEAARLLDLAGFTVERWAGVWDCDDHGAARPLAASSELEMVRRAMAAADAPQTSFLWWITARRTADPNPGALANLVDRVFTAAWVERQRRTIVAGSSTVVGTTVTGEGVLFYGPYFPLPPGRHTATFTVDVRAGGEGVLGWCEVVAGDRVLGRVEVVAAEPGRQRLDVDVELTDTTFGIETRATATGTGQIAIDRHVDWSALPAWRT